jgi:hypothetical protein
VWEVRSTYKILVRKSERTRQFGRSGHRRMDVEIASERSYNYSVWTERGSGQRRTFGHLRRRVFLNRLDFCRTVYRHPFAKKNYLPRYIFIALYIVLRVVDHLTPVTIDFYEKPRVSQLAENLYAIMEAEGLLPSMNAVHLTLS